ncbi:CoA-binding protein [Apibacter sp. HY039]|uniref:CoA-binding protein n=1 Tax=Apibacter sp. HY039 TaxID=2501476 RepID=UPI000FEBD9A8|nr:CoA-binding protein [Apibacter sp. HY039]
MKKTLVIGASENPERYSYKAVKLLRQYEHPVVAIGNKEGSIGDVSFSKELPDIIDLDTITLYLNPDRQKEYYEYIISLKPKRIIFNPGTENNELVKLAQDNNIVSEEACTLVLLRTNQY